MKIHRLKIKNIASLKGQHDIDFDSTLLERGSFAITGDTGAGKSTILNCVSLALFGRSYKGLNQGDFVTLGEASGKVELTFSCGGKSYLSIWGCRVRKKNGEYLKAPSHTKEFYQINGTNKDVLDITPEDVIHLSFDQFCKTVILNQGEFAKFLTSSFRERKDILEKLYQGDKLDVLNPLLRERISKFASQAEQANARIKGLGENIQEDITSEGLESLEAKTQEDQDRFKALGLRKDSLKDLLDNDKALDLTRSRIEEITKKIDSHIGTLNIFLKEKAAFDQEREKFILAQKERSPALHQALEWEKSIERLNEESSSLSSSLRGVQELVERSKRGLAKHTETLKVLTTNKADLEQSKNFKVLKDEQLEEASKKWDALNEALNKIEHLKDFGTHLSEALNKNEEKLIDSNKTLAQTKDKLAALRPLELENKLQDNDKLAIGLQALSIGVSNFQTEAERGAKEIKSLNLKLEETRSRLGKVQEKFDNEKNRIEAQKELIKGAQKAHARLICLQESIEKSQCVLCDSEQIEGVRAKADELKVQDFTLAQASIEEFEKEHENTFQELQRERSAHSALLAQLEQIKEKQKGAFSSLLADHLSSLSFIGQDGARPNIEDIEGSLVGHKKELETQKQDLRKKLQEATELSGRLQHLGKSIEDFKEEAEKLRPQHEQTQRDYRTHKTKADLLWADLQKIFGNLEISEIKACLLCANEAKNLDSKIRIEQKEGELIEERLKNAQKGLEETSASLKRASEEMLFLEKKVKETCGEQSPEEAIKRLEKEAHVIELKRKTMERDLKELEMEKSALFSRRQTFEEQRRDLENMGLKLWGEKRSELNGEFFSSEELIGLLKGLNKTDKAPSGEELELAHKLSEKDYQEAKETLEIAKGQLSEYRAILKRQESAKDQIKQLSKELNQLESQKEAWEELYLLIGKDEFRNYVLAMVEKLLIQQTNAELTKLCDGRYLIQHKASSSRLAPDFYIIDKFRGDETRKVSTLSGGETFMVSLAMALALAELTRGNADIDSFFIDEGFGTLDRDSLEEALEMLQDIETRGKQIGLISHVKELTNRIPVNIHLQKNRLGNSSIDIVYN